MNCYNSARYLAAAIDSVYAQTFTDWEIIFFDNCSTDESPKIAQSRDARLKYFRNAETVPLGAARNLAMARAAGEYIAFLDCDDLWCPEKLARQVSAMEADPKAMMVYSDALFFYDQGRSFRLYPRGNAPRGDIFRSLLRRYVLPMPTVMVRRDALQQAGEWFDGRFHMVEDADLFMRIAFLGPVAYVDQVLAKRRMHDESWTAKKKELFPKEESMLLAKFAALWPAFTKDYAGEIAIRKAIIDYQYAVLHWEQGNGGLARQRMKPHLGTFRKMWVPFLFSFLPYVFYKKIKTQYENYSAAFQGGVDHQAF